MLIWLEGSRTTPHEDNSPPDKNKAQSLPTRTTIPRTIPHQDNSPLGPLPRNKTTHQDQNLYGGELSSWGVLPYFGKRKQVTYPPNLSYWCFHISPNVLFFQAKFYAEPRILLRDMLDKTSWYSIDVSVNDRHILFFYKKCHFCHLLPFAKVGQSCPDTWLETYLSDEDVGGGIERFRGRCLHGALHQPSDLRDHNLHDSQVVQDGDGAAEVDDDW